jgi:hypothetical protein
MATRRFCDICDQPLTAEDDKPFVKLFKYYPPGGAHTTQEEKSEAIGHIMVTNTHGHILNDVCNPCKLKVVTDGTIYSTAIPPKIATLQPKVAADTEIPVSPFKVTLPEKPPLPIPPPIRFEPSMAPEGVEPKPAD